jgi:uncharacterized protein (TIGR03086 family)
VDELIDRHRRACDGFSAIVGQAEGRWNRPSPCTEWDARGVVEHVIGFHDVLLLRPMGTKPTRPKDDPATRWSITVPAIFSTLADASDGYLTGDAGIPDVDIRRLLPMLTTDVLVHTWDVARAVGVEAVLDADLCERSLALVLANEAGLHASDMFGPPLPVPDDADAQTKLLALLGRDPDGTR